MVLNMAVEGKGAFRQQISDALKEWTEMGLTTDSGLKTAGRQKRSRIDEPPYQKHPDLGYSNNTSLLVVGHLCKAISRVKPRNNATDHIDLYAEEPKWFNALISMVESDKVAVTGMLIHIFDVYPNISHLRYPPE